MPNRHPDFAIRHAWIVLTLILSSVAMGGPTAG